MGYTFGIIGCEHGHISIFIREMLAAGHRCAGLYEPENEELASAICRKFGIERRSSAEELLGDDVDLIGSSAVNNDKIAIIELCERHGKHIMVDKPAVTSREGLQRLEAVISRGRIQVGMLLTERFRGAVQALKQMVDQGELGELVSITMRKPHALKLETRPAWHFSKERNGGIVIDLFIHDFDLLRWLTGREVEETSGYVCKTGLPQYPDFYDTAALQLMMEGGVPAQLYADWHTPKKSWTWGDCRLFVSGTKGAAELRLSGDPLIDKDELLLTVTNDETYRQCPVLPETSIAEDFLQRIEGRPSLIAHEDIVAASRITVESDEKVRRLVRNSG